MLVKVKYRAIIFREWRQKGEIVDVPHDDAIRAIGRGVAESVDEDAEPTPEGEEENPPYGDPGEVE